MKQPSRIQSQKGYALIELMIVMVVLVVGAQAMAFFLRQMAVNNQSYRDRTFALEKAIQMTEELRAIAARSSSVAILDEYKDGYLANVPLYKYCLTVQQYVTLTGTAQATEYQRAIQPLSNNPIKSGQGYRFVRHVETKVDERDSTVRHVYVRVFDAAPNSANAAAVPAKALNPKAPLAEIFTTMRSSGTETPPTQVMDVYLIALESVPGWWARTSRLQGLMQNTIISLQARNPGLRFREHWITRMSYGRDIEYTPQMNSGLSGEVAGSTPFSKTYIYPTLITYDDGVDEYYSLNWFRARHNESHSTNTPGTIVDGEGYSIADQWNHCVRYPEEQRVYDIHRQSALANNNGVPEYSLRMLLEKMNRNDSDVRNCIVINLHGEMVPVLPIRNYSDPAKDPTYYWNERPASLTWTAQRAFRSVTHPEQLHFVTWTAQVALRVFAWDQNTPADTITPALENDLLDTVTVFIPNADLSHLKQVDRLQGNSGTPYHWYSLSSTTWVNSGTEIANVASPLTSTATFIADNYTTWDGRSGLRLRFLGVTPTARAYNGPIWVGP